MRVDLGEVEACLRELPRVEASAARTWGLPVAAGKQASITETIASSESGSAPANSVSNSRTVIVAYVVVTEAGAKRITSVVEEGDDGAAGLAQELRAALRDRLPPAAVPGHIFLLPSLPRTPSGKLIRSQLPRPSWMSCSPTDTPLRVDGLSATLPNALISAGSGGEISAEVHGDSCVEMPAHNGNLIKHHPGSRGPVTESTVMAAFCRSLGRRSMEPTEDFFAAGGTSLGAALVAAELGTDPALMYVDPCTARRLAALIRADGSLPPSDRPRIGGIDPSGVARIGPVAISELGVTEIGAEGHRADKRHKTDEGQGEDLERGELMLLVKRWRHSLSRCRGLVTLTGANRTSFVTLAPGAPTSSYPPKGSSPVPSEGQSDATDGTMGGIKPRQAPSSTETSIRSSEKRSLSVAWSYPLGRCIDASPLLIKLQFPQDGQPVSPGGPASSTMQHSSSPELAEVVLACSHDGSVACLDNATGRPLWYAKLPGRAEAGMCVSGHSCGNLFTHGSARGTDKGSSGSLAVEGAVAGNPYFNSGSRHHRDVGARPRSESGACVGESSRDRPRGSVCGAVVTVACGDGRMHFLDLEDGLALGRSPPLPGGLRAAPAVDPWPGCGLAWVCTHGSELVAVAAPTGSVLARYEFVDRGMGIKIGMENRKWRTIQSDQHISPHSWFTCTWPPKQVPFDSPFILPGGFRCLEEAKIRKH